MAKEMTAKYGNYTINIEDSGTVKVSNLDSECKNTMAALREIAKLVGFTLEEKWNTRQSGKKLVKYLNTNPMTSTSGDFLEITPDTVIDDTNIALNIDKIRSIIRELAKEIITPDTIIDDTNIDLNRAEIRSTMSEIAKEINSPCASGNFSYNDQREMINRIFRNNMVYDCSTLMLRLVVIDSLYSTNAAYSYFSIEEMAKKIGEIGCDSDTSAYFYDLVTKKDVDDKNDRKLFSTPYGIRKNLSVGSLQTSLMSKYAYYLLLQNKKTYPLGFPIYDSLAIKTYPKVCKMLGINPSKEIKISNTNIDIKTYISALDELRKAIFKDIKDNNFEDLQQFDILDAYLWRIGKIDEGNFSLLLDHKDYETFIKNIGLDKKEKEQEQDYAERLYEQYHFEQPKLVKCQNKKLKNGVKKETYTYNFNGLVRYEIEKRDVKDIVKELNQSEYISMLIGHWKEYYCNF